MEYKIQSWNTWKKKNNPTIYECNDGMFQYLFSIAPTLTAHGFVPVGDEETYYEVKNKKQQASIIVDNFRKYKNTNNNEFDEFVYWIHYGRNQKPMIVYVYGRKSEDGK